MTKRVAMRAFKSKLNSNFKIFLSMNVQLLTNKFRERLSKNKKTRNKLWKETQSTDLHRQSSFHCLDGNVKREEKISKPMKILTLNQERT
jgi:hypothetical protein